MSSTKTALAPNVPRTGCSRIDNASATITEMFRDAITMNSNIRPAAVARSLIGSRLAHVIGVCP